MITETLIRYKQLADYCAPEYERDNQALTDFKSKYPSLTTDQTHELQCLLTGDDEYTKFFVADLLYLYHDFDEDLLEPMITTAIRYHDPSFNRIFVKPCIRRFGYPKVLTLIKSKLISGDIVDRIGVANIFYHLRPGELLS